MVAPWSETPARVVVEFLKGNQGASRVINLRHTPNVLPPQLQGRVQPAAWQAFMSDVQQAAQEHPYVVPPSAGRVGGWLGAACVGAVLGVCCVSPDGGDYNVWLNQVQSIIHRHQPAFASGGASLALRSAQRSHWIQIDIGPAVGQPAPGAQQERHQQQQWGVKPGYEPAKPGYEPHAQQCPY